MTTAQPGTRMTLAEYLLTTLTIPRFELPLEQLFGHSTRTRSLSR